MNEFENEQEVVEEQVQTEVVEETPVEPEVETTPEEPEVDHFAELQQQFEALQASYNELNQQYQDAQNRIAELETFQQTANTDLEALRQQNTELQATITSYETQVTSMNAARKNDLINKYEKMINEEEEIERFRAEVDNYSYDELESKLAITFANQQMAQKEVEEDKVPLIEPQESQFALLMKKYRKN